MVSRVTEARAYVLNVIREGVPPGGSISVKETAEAVRMSHTPVREALERLVGEGVLASTPDRQGFAVPRLTVRDVSGLHRLFGTLLGGLVDGPSPIPSPSWIPDALDPSAAIAEVVAPLCRNPATAVIAAALRSTELRLTAYRSVEPKVVSDWAGDLVRLREGLAKDRRLALHGVAAFTAARVNVADGIVAAVEDLHGGHAADSFRI